MPASALTFLRMFLGVSLGLTAFLALVIATIDPYGNSPVRLPIERPIMDINQRYMYPQIVRSQRYDSVVIGTSTSRLLDPEQLNAAFGGHFANLAMNAATAWEQTELAKLFLRHQPNPKSFIVGLDHMWCQDQKTLQKITFRGFPTWMYDENPWNDLPELLNLKTLEITGRLIAFHLGLMPERIRRDGYEIFTPPEATYDLARARWHIWGNRPEQRITPVAPPVTLSAEDAKTLTFPALVWLEELLKATSSSSFRMLAFMPVHIASQPTPGSADAAKMAVCMERISAIAQRHGVRLVDFAIPSDITSRDENYWDPLHYRLPIASRIVNGMQQAQSTGADAADGTYRLR